MELLHCSLNLENTITTQKKKKNWKSCVFREVVGAWSVSFFGEKVDALTELNERKQN